VKAMKCWKRCSPMTDGKALDRLKRGETHLGWTLWQPFIGEAWKREFVGRVPDRKNLRDCRKTPN